MNKPIVLTLVSFIFMVGCSGTIPELGVNAGQLMPCPDKPNCVSTQAADDEHFIQPIEYMGTVQEAQDRMLQVLRSMQRTKIIAIEENYIRVEFTSSVFRFVDDAEFSLESATNGKIVINLRSASRIGHSDFGVNRERIEQIRSQLTSSNE